MVNNAILKNRFHLVREFKIVVPKNYNHATCLRTFRDSRNFYYYDDGITDEHYQRVTRKLIPEEKFNVKLFSTSSASFNEWLSFVYSQGGALVGAQGASIVYEQCGGNLLEGTWSASLDVKRNLWKDTGGLRWRWAESYGKKYFREDGGGHRGVPGIGCRSINGDLMFSLRYFDLPWLCNYYLLCFLPYR